MNTDLLEIQPQELRFIFELKKQSSCSVRLVNKSNHHVAFKVKTTSPKKYCVRPNTGVIKPKSACDFTVTMQAQKVAPPDLICKDKFLVQWTTVPAGTEDEDISTTTFAKEDGKRVQEKKLRVILLSPPNSPVLSPINGTLNQVQAYEPMELKDQVAIEKQNLSSHPKVIDYVEESKIEISEDQETRSNVESRIVKDTEELRLVKDVDEMKSKVKDTVELKLANDVDEMKSKVKDTVELKLVNKVDEMKTKLKELESKLGEAEVTISKLTYEKGLTTHEKEKLRQELELVRSKKTVTRRVQVGFPLLFVCMVALISLYLGYQLHR